MGVVREVLTRQEPPFYRANLVSSSPPPSDRFAATFPAGGGRLGALLSATTFSTKQSNRQIHAFLDLLHHRIGPCFAHAGDGGQEP